MDYVRLGSTGLKVSRLCLGTMTYGTNNGGEWVLDEEAGPAPLLRHALELGINFFDTADMYSLGVSEEILGRALRDFGPGRDKVVIGTKVYQRNGRRARTSADCRASTSCIRSTTACAGWAPITWTCTRFTASITRRPSRKRSSRWMPS